MRRFSRPGAAIGLLAFATFSANAQSGSGISLIAPLLPSATANVSYSTSLAGVTVGGTPPYTYSSAVLPQGLGMNSTGLITGTPTTATSGYFTGSVTIADSSNPAHTATGLALYIQVFPQPLTISTAPLPRGIFGTFYSQPIPVSGGVPPYSFTANPLARTGLSLDSSTGILSGTPAAPGPISFRVQVADHQGSQALQSFTLQTDSNLVMSVPAPVEVPVGGAVSVTLSVSGGLTPYVWTPVGQLPAGLNLSTAGVLSGATSQPGNLAIPVQVTDGQGFTAQAAALVNNFGIANTNPLPAGTTVAPYYAIFDAVGGTPPYNFSATGLPSGLTLPHFGNLSGLVTQPGTYSFTVQVRDGTGVTVSSNYSLTIAIPSPLSMTVPSLANGTVQAVYSAWINGSTSGGNPPYRWTLQSGTLPPGIGVSTTGILSGTPTTAGTFGFTLLATDGSGATGSLGLTIQINPPALTITTQSPLTSGIVNAQYPSQILTASGGVGPYTFSIVSPGAGNLPSGLTLNNGVIAGIPTASGDFSVTIQAQDALLASAQTTLALHVRAQATDLILSTETLSFALSAGASSLPASQNVTVVSSDTSQSLPFSIQVTPASTWLSVSTAATTPNPLSVSLTSQALALATAPGTYTATVALTCTSSSCLTPIAQNVTVTLTIANNTPLLNPVTDLLSFSATSLSSAASTQPVTVQNAGGGVLNFTSVSCEAPWCSAGSVPAPLPGGSSASVAITADPTGLPAGYYRTTVDFLSSGGPVSIPVTLLVAQAAEIVLAPSGAQVPMQAGGAPGNLNGSFLIGISGTSTLNWTASVISGPWLSVTSPGGAASGDAPGTVNYSIDPSAVALLPAAPQYAIIQVTAPGSIDSPQYFEVILNITPASSPLTPQPTPAGLVFLTESAAAPPPQTIQVQAAGSQTGFQAAAATSDGAHWLSVNPPLGTTSSATPAQVQVSVDPTGLTPGVYHGGVSFSFTSASAPTVNVTLIVEDTLAAPTARLTTRTTTPAARCAPSALAPTQTGLVNNFSAPASWPTPLSILLLDNCGNSMSGAQIVATFSNGDPPLVLAPANTATGLYSGTWTPRSPGPQVSINAQATMAGFPASHLQITGQVTPNTAPVLTPHGTLNVFNPQVGAPLAPGTIVQIYGTGLAPESTVAGTLPLPKSMSGTSLIIGGISAPLFYVGPNQINAQVPFELDPNSSYQVIASANGSYTAPITIQLAPVTPGLAAYSDGGLIAQHADGSLINAASPAKPGEYVVAYLAGLGNTTVPVATGAQSPQDPLAWAGVTPTLTLNGVSTPVLFAGMTPGLVGLYQINFQIPASQPDGPVTLVVAQGGFPSNSTTLPVQH